MSSTPRPSKRPRLSQSSSASTLRAPFKSPLRPRDSTAPSSSLSIPSKHAAAQTKTNHIATNSGPAGASPSPGKNSRDQELPPTRKSKSESKIENDVLLITNPGWRPTPPPPIPSQEAEQQQRSEASAATAAAALFDDGRKRPADNDDDDLISLQRTHTRLLNTLAASKRDLETALQARKLEASSSPSSSTSASSIPAASLPSHPGTAVDTYDNCTENRRLKDLIDKWRGASRDAAEVVYASAKERVEGMGGVKGMRAREREKWKWLREEERAEQEVSKQRERKRKIVDIEGDEEEDEEEMGGEDDAGGKKEEEEGDDEAEGADEDGTADGQEEEDEGGGGEYTMGMMLQGFGIHPKTMGWDEAGGKWID